MQYNTQQVFHLNPYPGPSLYMGGKHSTCDLFPQGRLLHVFPSTSLDISDDVSLLLCAFCCCWTHFLRPYRTYESHTDGPSRQTVSTASGISNENTKKKNKTDMRLSQCEDNFIYWGRAGGWGGGGVLKEKSKILWLVHGLIIPLNHVEASSKTSLVLNRKKLPNYSFYSLSSLSLLYITIPLKLKQRFDLSFGKVLSNLSTFLGISLPQSFLLSLATHLYTLPLSPSYCQMKTIAE